MNIRKIIGIVVMGAAIFTNIPGVNTVASAAENNTESTSATATAWPKGPKVGSKSAVLMDVDSGTVLYNKKGDTKHYPASITKVMTALVALEHSDLSDTVTFSQKAVEQSYGGTSSISRDVGEKMTMEETLYGMMLESANECAWAIAEHVGGTEENFIKMMNEKAKELGCTHTHFHNPNGLPDDQHWTTALDMARISRAAYQNPTFAKICSTKHYIIPPTNKHKDETYLNNHHCMLNFYHTSRYLYDYCVGGKTGYTTKANSTLVTYARKDGMTLVCVVMCAKSPDHWNDTRKLIDWGFKNFKNVKVSELKDLSQATDKLGSTTYGADSTLIEPSEDGSVMLPKKAELSDVDMTVEKSSSASKNIVGLLVFSYDGRKVGTTQLLSTETEDSVYPFHNLSTSTNDGKNGFLQLNILLIVVIAAIALAIAIGLFFLLKNILWAVQRKRRDSYSDKKGRIKYKKIRNNQRK
ncbi:MAG: D-alanyl-D-alanine carboxypeptidase [Lachnospiraceae bacterium]|nr:D-alanyl-D-alanine carboxypeptidase [Lachnospiraceae bacterium]MDY2758536.1 D-alanyl-D-alanine carboxypeptidase family protein [Lachnospiraceae bacterium]